MLEALESFELMDIAALFAAIMGHPAAWVAIVLFTIYIVLNSKFAANFWNRRKNRRNGNGD